MLQRVWILLIAVAFFLPSRIFAVELFSRDLYFGLRDNTEVEQLQRFLTDKGFYSGPVNGNFYGLTREGVKKFQAAYGIEPAAGYFGPKSQLFANRKILEDKIAALRKQIETLRQELAQATEMETGETSPATTTPAADEGVAATSSPSVSLPNPFTSSLKIENTLSSMTLSTYGEKILTEFRLVADEKAAVTRLRFKNSGTLRDDRLVNLRLINSKTEAVLATVSTPVNKVIEFKMTANDAKADKGLLVSGGTYYVFVTILTPNAGAEKPYIRLDLESAADVSVFDYNDLTRVADISKSNTFPIIGPKISTF